MGQAEVDGRRALGYSILIHYTHNSTLIDRIVYWNYLRLEFADEGEQKQQERTAYSVARLK